MKKVKLFVLMLLSGTTIFISSCSKDKNTTPTITFIGGTGFTSQNASFNAGDTIKVGINAAKGPDGSNLQEYKIERVFNNNVTTQFDTTNMNIANYTRTIKIRTNTSAGTEKFKFEITDKDGNTAEIEFNITTTIHITYGQINTWTGKVLGDQYQSSGSWFSSTTDTVYTNSTYSANVAKIDIFYRWFTANNSEAFMSYADSKSVDPSAPAPLTGATTTHFGTSSITASAFDNITNDSALQAIPTLSALYVNVSNGNVYSFVNSIGKKGLIKVTALDTTDNTGSITISVKVQK